MNRKERRAKSPSDRLKSADDIPLSAPDYNAFKAHGAKTKTLLEIAMERQAELLGPQSSSGKQKSPGENKSNPIRQEDVVQLKIGHDGQIIPDASSSIRSPSAAPDAPRSTVSGLIDSETPWLDTFLLASSLSAMHFTLSVLAMHQYAEELRLRPLVAQTVFVAFPTLSTLIAVFHGLLLPASMTSLSAGTKYWVLTLRSCVYVVTANIAGCYLIQVTNDRGYYQVMKDAPGVGTIWVWAVLEMRFLGALAGVLGPGIYAWWFGYGVW